VRLVPKIDELKRMSRKANTLTLGDYESALKRAEGQISEAEYRFLQTHYQWPGHTATATELALALGYREYRATNLIYGRLAKKLQLGVAVPRGYGGIGFIVVGERPKAGEHWKLRLRPELAAALEQLAWFPKVARRGMAVDRAAKGPNYKKRFKIAIHTGKWAVTMTKVCIRQAIAHKPFPFWHFATFAGPGGREARGVVDLIAIRKDHGTPRNGLKRGDALQIVLIQVKGGIAAKPTADDAKRLRIVARQHGAREVLLAAWKKGKAARFYSLRKKTGALTWIEITDLRTVFC